MYLGAMGTEAPYKCNAFVGLFYILCVILHDSREAAHSVTHSHFIFFHNFTTKTILLLIVANNGDLLSSIIIIADN